MTYLLVAVLALSAGWCWGHSTARVRYAFIGGTREQDRAAIRAAIQAEIDQRFKELTADLDRPDDPWSST